jgi:predicted ATPase/DNA-binding CsgD family transcriptional regulator
LIGRAAEAARIREHLMRTDVRLLTLCGVGGIGKTRLALEVARAVQSDFADGSRFVELAPFREPALVVSAIHASVDPEQPPGSREALDALKRCLQRRHLLLVLDNFEQVLDAAPVVAELLATCPELTVLATSRAPLRVSWEREFAVGPLEIPSTDLELHPEALAACPSVALLIERMAGIGLAGGTTTNDLAALAAICRRLDGIPLAIELAAARAKVLSPQALLGRLERPLELLTGGPVDKPVRHQALRSTFEWSYQLLSAADQRLFRCLGVFVGGCSVESAARVAGVEPADDIGFIDALGRLVDSGLVSRVDFSAAPEPRVKLLEPVREYALELLEAHGEYAAMQQRHVEAYLVLAELAQPEMQGHQQRLWQARLDRDHANALQALRWCVDHGEAELGQRLTAALGMYWWIRGFVREGLERMQSVLALSQSESTPHALSARARATAYAGALQFWHGQIADAEASLNAALDLYATLDEPSKRAFALVSLANCALSRGNFERAALLYSESHAQYRLGGDPGGMARTTMNLGLASVYLRHYERALGYLEEGITQLKAVGDISAAAFGMRYLAMTHCHRGDFEAAQASVREGLQLWREAGSRVLLPFLLEAAVMVAAGKHQAARAITLAAAADAIRDELEARAPASWTTELDRWLAPVLAALGADGAARARQTGRALGTEGAVRFAMSDDVQAAAAPGSAANSLTPRETEVLRLLAMGNMNKEIASQLLLSVATVERHVANVYAKIGARGRADATAYAITRGLASRMQE